MPMPRWWAHMNKRVFNPRALAGGNWTVLNHVGSSSGRSYRTPLGGWEVEGTRMFPVVYGPKTDWLRNVMKSGVATLEVDGAVERLERPRVLTDAVARPLLSGVSGLPPRFLNVDAYLQMDIVSREPAGTNL